MTDLCLLIGLSEARIFGWTAFCWTSEYVVSIDRLNTLFRQWKVEIKSRSPWCVSMRRRVEKKWREDRPEDVFTRRRCHGKGCRKWEGCSDHIVFIFFVSLGRSQP